MLILKNAVQIITFFLCFQFSFTVFSQNDKTAIENLVEQKRSFNKSNKNMSIYKIQIFNGSETDAYKIKSEFEMLYPEFTLKVVYKAPEWKLHVVNFVTRLDAERALLAVKKNYIGAFVLED